MDAQSLVNLAQIVLVGIFVLVSINLYLVFRLKEIDPFRRWNANLINGGLFMLFLIGGIAAAVISTNEYKEYFTLLYDPASLHGAEIDRMMWNTLYVSIVSAGITVILLFYFSWRYRHREGQKALYYPHNNRLEVVWTIVPAVVLTILVFDGVGVWHDIWADPKEDEEVFYVEVMGKQFDWTVRYPGDDQEFGEYHVSFINDGTGNTMGLNLDDKRGHDDLIVREMHIPVNKKVVMNVRSRDVLHSATLAHFRVKMDAVPGMPTYFPFVPTITTEEYREQTGKGEDFNFQMSCQQICGGGHWNMGIKVVVETEEEVKAWLENQKTFIAQYNEINGIEPNTAEAASVEEAEAPAEEVAMN